MADTIADLERAKMLNWLATGPPLEVMPANSTAADVAYEYYYQRSAIANKMDGSVTDHQRSYYKTVTGLTTGSLADLEKAFYDTKGIAAGTNQDRAYIWWSGVIT